MNFHVHFTGLGPRLVHTIQETVTIPIKSSFIYGMSGAPATGSLNADSFSSLSLFVVGGGVKGKECTPLIKIDNIRCVPN